MSFVTIFEFKTDYSDLTNSQRNFLEKICLHADEPIKLLIRKILTKSPLQTYIPPITELMIKLNDLQNLSLEDKAFIKENTFKLLMLFVKTQKRYLDYEKPFTCNSIINSLYNYRHFGNICHLNCCLNILSSLSKLLVKYYNSEDITNLEFKILLHEILGNLSPIHPNPDNINTLIKILGINSNAMLESAETFKSIMKILYNFVALDEIFYWDCSEPFTPKEHKLLPFVKILSIIQPDILIVNNQDFNVVNEIDDAGRCCLEFVCSTENDNIKYVLTSIIVNIGAHFISILRLNPHEQNTFGVGALHDDLLNRFDVKQLNFVNNKFPIAIACYVRCYE